MRAEGNCPQNLPAESSTHEPGSTQRRVDASPIEELHEELLRMCLDRLCITDQVQLSGANRFLYSAINKNLMKLTRAIPQENTELGNSITQKLRERFPALCVLLITGALSPKKMTSLAEHWATLTQDLTVEIQNQMDHEVSNSSVTANPITTIVPYVSNPHAQLLEILDDAPNITKVLNKQKPGSGAALFQLFKSLSNNSNEYSPITKLNLSGVRSTASEEETRELVEAFISACKTQQFINLQILNLSNIKFEIKQEKEAAKDREEKINFRSAMLPAAEYFDILHQTIPTISGGILLKQFFNHSSCKELREIRATHMYLEGEELQAIGFSIKSNHLLNLNTLDLSQILNLHYSTEASEEYDQFILELVSNPPPNLTELQLPPAPNGIGNDNSLDQLTEAFKDSKFKALKILNISRPDKPLFHPYRTDILHYLDRCPNLQEFHNARNYLGDEQFKNFCNHLEQTLRHIKLLDLSCPSEVDVLERPNPSLIRLIDALVGKDMVKTPSQLESLKLTQWPCMAEEIQSLYTAIAEFRLPNLKHISLPYLDALSLEQQQDLFSMLKSRRIDFHVQERPYIEDIEEVD